MKGLSNLIDINSPSIVFMQSGVLLVFMICFLVVAWRISGSKQKIATDEIARRALED